MLWTKIIAIIGNLLLSFYFYISWRFMVEERNKNDMRGKHPIFYTIIEYLTLFLVVAWIITFYTNIKTF